MSEVPASELVADPLAEEQTPSKSVLLASVPPSLFISLGAASASVVLLAVLLAALYIRRVRKRDSQLAGTASLRSSLQLNDDEDYMEKTNVNRVVSSSDSYDTLASFTQVAVGRAEPVAWDSHYTAPSLQTEYAIPLPKKDWRVADWRSTGSDSFAASPLVGRRTPHPPSLSSLHSGQNRLQARVGPVYSGEEPGSYHQYQYSGGRRGEASQYSGGRRGEASPYSVSSELYKHVLPQYFHFNRPGSRGSVLV